MTNSKKWDERGKQLSQPKACFENKLSNPAVLRPAGGHLKKRFGSPKPLPIETETKMPHAKRGHQNSPKHGKPLPT